MADFRKLFLVLVVGVLFATAASAIDYHCDASSVPTLARAEGLAEPMGDVKLDCSGDLPNPAAGMVVNIRLTLSTNVTSNVLTVGTPVVTDATLVLDRGLPGGFVGYQSVSAATSSSGTNTLLPYSDGHQNVYQAVRISDTEIEWQGVVLAGPGSPAHNQVLLTNVRGNASGVGAGAPISATINITTPTSLTINNNSLVVANTRQGLTFSVSSAGNFQSCIAQTCAQAGKLNFMEGFNVAFRPGLNNLAGSGPYNTHDVPGGAFADESGFNPVNFSGSLAGGSLIGLTSIGRATQGTRLVSRIKAAPAGASLGAPLVVVTASGLVLELVTGTASDFSGGTFATASSAFTCTSGGYSLGDISLDSSGNGAIVYEVIQYVNVSTTAPALQDTVSIPVFITFSKPGTPGVATANGNFAPISTVATMSATAPEPRFIDSATDKTLFTITLCRTILLFPDITNQAGFDTGIAISNTSADPLQTSGQAGTCSLNYYGNTNGAAGPAAQTTPSIPAGGQLLMLLSTGGSVLANGGGAATACASGACLAPGFQGYMIAICNFQYAHGFAYISDLGATKLAQGYLALIIPDRGTGKDVRAPDPMSTAGSTTGENLAN
jgi:hypothetical protein